VPRLLGDRRGMRGDAMNDNAHRLAADLLREAEHLPIGMERDSKIRAAWNLDQLARGIASCDWTEYPPEKGE
jgi:hypothetical protein